MKTETHIFTRCKYEWHNFNQNIHGCTSPNKVDNQHLLEDCCTSRCPYFNPEVITATTTSTGDEANVSR